MISSRKPFILILCLLYTFQIEVLFNSWWQFSSPITLLDHIQSSSTSDAVNFIISKGWLLSILLLFSAFVFDFSNISLAFLKFFEIFPSLIDLIDLLFIYQSNSKDKNVSNRLNLTLVLCLIHLTINLNTIDEKLNRQWKRILNYPIYILVNVSVIRYSNFNPFHMIRKLIVGVLILRLNHPYFSARSKSLILSVRLVISLLLICLFIFYSIRSTLLGQIPTELCLESCGLISMVSALLLWDNIRSIPPTNLLSQVKFTTTPSQTCAVCYDEKDSSAYALNIPIPCHHRNRSVCNSCLFQHVQQTFQTIFTDDIFCPESQCRVKFNYDTVRYILQSSEDKTLMERYDRYVVHRQLEQMEEFIWCSNPRCQVGQLNEGGADNRIVTCFDCHQKTCFIHRIQWHEGMTCEEYDQNIDLNLELSRRWIVDHCKTCPQCPYEIEKNDGCDHITCSRCGHEFCWSCLAAFQPIRQYGNHHHKSVCKHFFPYDGE